MSGAYYHQGLTIEFDVSVPRLTIEGRELPTEQLAGIFALSESPSVKAEKLRQYGKEIIERSPGFQKRESTRQTHLAILKREYQNGISGGQKILKFDRSSMTVILAERPSLLT